MKPPVHSIYVGERLQEQSCLKSTMNFVYFEAFCALLIAAIPDAVADAKRIVEKIERENTRRSRPRHAQLINMMS